MESKWNNSKISVFKLLSTIRLRTQLQPGCLSHMYLKKTSKCCFLSSLKFAPYRLGKSNKWIISKSRYSQARTKHVLDWKHSFARKLKGIESLPQTQMFLISISLEADGVNLWYFKLRLFDNIINLIETHV